MNVSIVVATRDRPNFIGSLVESILANTYRDFVFLIVDQSTTDRTKKIVERYIVKDSRIRYFSMTTRGKSKALNLGIKNSSGKIIAFTDDDCVVTQDWVEKIVSFLTDNKEVSIVFGREIVAAHDITKGTIGFFEPRDKIFPGRCSIKFFGSGANMAIRREVFEKIGYFDEFLGPGAYFGGAGGEDYDFVFRAMKKGFKMATISSPVLTHFGFRDWERLKYLYKNYLMGVTAFQWKHIRCNDYYVLWDFIYVIFIPAKGIIVGPRFSHKSLLFRLLYVTYLIPCIAIIILKGIIESFKYRVDKERLLYVPNDRF